MPEHPDSISPEQEDSLVPADGFPAEVAAALPGLTLATWITGSQWVGPLPPPNALQVYDELNPGTSAQLINLHVKRADHAMEMERQQADHTMEMERQQQVADRKAESQGRWVTFVLVLAALLTVAVVGSLAAGLVTIPVAGLPIVYVAFRAWEKRKLLNTVVASSETGRPDR